MLSNNTAVDIGGTVFLSCVGRVFPNMDITWRLNGRTVGSSSLVTIYEEEVVRGVRVYKHSYLQLCGVRQTNAGDYTCVVSNGFATTTATTRLTVRG